MEEKPKYLTIVTRIPPHLVTSLEHHAATLGVTVPQLFERWVSVTADAGTFLGVSSVLADEE